MNILITGCCGYLGSRLCQQPSKNYHVIGVDNLLFNQGHLVHHTLRDVEFYNTDVDNIPYNVVKRADVCLPMACLVGMTITKQNPKMAQRVNKDSIVNLIGKLRQDCKLIVPSTNSGYGTSTEICDENTPLNSVSLYGKLKEELEESVLSRDNSVIFRLATVFGLSPRPRLDLLVNCLTYDAYFMVLYLYLMIRL